MDRSLARGYANRYLDQLTPHSDLIDWYDGPRRRKAFDVFMTSTLSKKPGRVLDRMRPHLAPVYRSPTVVRWERHNQLVSAIAVSSGKASSVLEFGGEDQALFDEKAVFLSHMLFSGDKFSGESYAVTNAGICGHAIQRCLERDLATPDTLRQTVSRLLQLAGFIEAALSHSSLSDKQPWGFLFPFPGGAAGGVTQRVRAASHSRDNVPDFVISIRTVLKDSMISPEQRDRMGADYMQFLDIMARHETGLAWILRNSRPWVANDRDDDLLARAS